MKMNHLTKETVGAIMEKVREVIATQDFSKMETIFALSEVKGDLFLKCRENPIQAQNVNFELDAERGVRFLDPFSFYTGGIYKDVDGWTRWTIENLKEPWT